METKELELQLQQIKGQILEAVQSNNTELKGKIEGLQKQADALDVKLAERHAGGGAVSTKGIADLLKENEDFARLQRDKRGTAVITLKGADLAALERKTLVDSTAVGASTSGVLRIDRDPGIVAEARQQLTIRNLLRSRPTSLQIIDYVKVNSPMVQASPQQGEGHTKLENAVTFTTDSERVKTIATWIPASKQVLNDFAELGAFISDSLMYYVNLAEELSMLSGSGAGEDLNGLITQATTFDSSLLSLAGWNQIDVVGAAIQQVNEAKEIDPSFVALNARDWWTIRRLKDSFGRYLLGDPNSPESRRLWDLDVLPTQNMTSGTFLVGSGNPAATEIRDAMEAQVEVSTQHEDYFARNLVAVRCEKRVALVTKRAASFIYGTFTTSP